MADKRFIKGLFKDTGHIDQPEGSWRYAKNAIVNDKKGSISNEGGTELSGHLGEDPSVGAQNDKVIGKIEVNDNRVILFVTDVITTTNPRSEIGIWEDGDYTILYNPSPAMFPEHDLNFKEDYPIEGTFKIDSKGDLVIYWTDDLNPPRAFNVDRQIRDTIDAGFPTATLYGITTLKSVELLNLFPHAGPVPRIGIADIWWGTPPYQEVVNTGGGLRTGVYYLALAYVDDDFVSTNFLTVSNPVSIVDEYDATRPTTKKDGAKEGSQTSKSITWRVYNMNTDYRYMRPVVVRKMGDATDAFKLDDVEIEPNLAPNPFMNIIFSGIEGFESASVEEVIIDTVSYDTAKTIQQLDGVLYVGNLTGSKDVGWQKYANNVKLNSIVRTLDPFDEYWATMDNLTTGFGNSQVDEGNYVDHTKSYRFIPNVFKYLGYMRDEIYSFYIAFILNDGSMSYAYHIPGRSKLEAADYSSYNVLGSFTSNDEDDELPSAWRSHYSDYARLFQFYDLSSLNTGSNSNSGGACRHMNFWENMTEVYPNNDNYEIWDETNWIQEDSGIPVTPIGDLRKEKVRHHHFPSNENQDRKTITDNDSVVLPTVSTWTPPNTSHYTGQFRTCINNGHNGGSFWMNDTWGGTLGNVGRVNNGTNVTVITADNPNNTIPPFLTTHNDHCVEATADNTEVSVHVHYKMLNDSTWCSQYGYVRVYTDRGGTVSVVPISPGTPTCSNTGNSTVWNDAVWVYLGLSGSNDTRVLDSGGFRWTVSGLSVGEKVWVQGLGTQRGLSGVNCTSGASTPRRVDISDACWGNSSCSYGASGSWTRWQVRVLPPPMDDYRDVDLKHKVRPLGFELEDIKIPPEIAEKVQGFRVYRSKRDHSNKTIIGQDILKPMRRKTALVGICQEAILNTNILAGAQQALETSQDKDEGYYINDAYSYPIGNYTVPTETDQNDLGEAYKVFSFHDFHLLRTKNSLAPATHIKVEYVVGNYVWNGPDINQDKKMLTDIDSNNQADSGLYRITERWGWDATTGTMEGIHCYSQFINSALLIGGEYASTGDTSVTGQGFHYQSYELNRPLLQKAKTYILGDSVFNGSSLGFGGKITNNFGETHIALGLKDGLELPALQNIHDLDGSGGITNDPYNIWGMYIVGQYFTLVNDNTQLIDDAHDARAKSYLINLKSYKTDVYKAIDSNELVWTGFEVLADDLDNYIFDDTGTMAGTGNTVDTHPNGIWGGDTFICRHGVGNGITPMDSATSSIPNRAVHYHIVESPDNINFRHEESVQTAYYPQTAAQDMLQLTGTEDHDFTHQDKMLYNANYSEHNDIRTAFPLPLRENEQSDFPTRAHRSAKADPTSLIDNWRIFLANQFKDLPKNRGELWKLASFNNLLYFHMEETLYAAKGKQSMQMKDGSEAFVGSGDIFQQEPDEIVQTQDGFGGTQSQYAALTTRHGYFFVDIQQGKVFLMTDQLQEISKLGMENWFRDNIPLQLFSFGMTETCDMDNPIVGFGYHSIWDPKYRRIILTKREYIPTQNFIDGRNADLLTGSSNCTLYPINYIRWNPNICRYQQWTQTFCPSSPCPCSWNTIEWNNTSMFTKGGWSISYFPEMGTWVSFHDYIPYIYFNTSTTFYSLTDKFPRPVWVSGTTTLADHEGTTFGNAGIWKHNDESQKGVLYQDHRIMTTNITLPEWEEIKDIFPFEFEVIHNEHKAETTLLANFEYTLETFNQEDISVFEHGFTSYVLYNTHQLSGIGSYWQDLTGAAQSDSNGTVLSAADINSLEYLVNIRQTRDTWKVNNFRDMAVIALNTNNYYMSTNQNIIGQINTGTITNSSTNRMWTVSGAEEIVNAAYLDLGKNWNLQKKFIDKWVGIRLIYNNITNNLLNLYSTKVGVRKTSR